MFHESYLFNPQGIDTPLKKSVFKRAPVLLTTLGLVVPRSLCTYFQINCVGVPHLKLAAFARLQVQAASPFVSCGSCVIRQGDWLHAWVWDAAIEAAFAAKHGEDRHFSVLSQSLFSTPVKNGVTCSMSQESSGVELQLWLNSRLIDSLWLDSLPDADAWTSLLARIPELSRLGWPTTLVEPNFTQAVLMPLRPWGRNLTPRKHHRARINWIYLVVAGLLLTTAALAGWGAWLYAQKESYQQAIAQGLASQGRRIAELEPVQKARQKTQQTLVWVNTASALAPSPGVHEVLAELADIFTRQGLVVRELEISFPTLQATLVATSGGAPRLTAVLGALESHPLFEDARFVDVSGGAGFKFAWRMRPSKAANLNGKQP